MRECLTNAETLRVAGMTDRAFRADAHTWTQSFKLASIGLVEL